MLERKAKIVCTVGRIELKSLVKKIGDFVKSGMDVARINMSHYDLTKPNDKHYLSELIKTIRDEAKKHEKFVAILGDIQGPKVRIASFIGEDNNGKFTLKKDDKIILTNEAKIPKGKKGVILRYEGDFDFFQDIIDSLKKDKPVEFWFADGKIMMAAKHDEIKSTFATCKVIESGELKIGQGVSVKNATIKPEDYALYKYPKDSTDICFLLEHEIDFIALSFVNSKNDVVNLQNFIKSKTEELKLRPIQERFLGMKDFPIISKIETKGGILRIDEIMKVSYGIMVARGDLALRTGIQNIGIYQKQVIDKCLTKGIPVITATQMLLSMMEFKEPRRSEVTDVTNAIFDGTDALMLSDETADPTSKFPEGAIQMMGDIAEETDKENKRLNEIEYEYKIGQRFRKIQSALNDEEVEIDKLYDDRKIETSDYENRKVVFERKKTTDNVSHNACKMAHDDIKCKAIVVLTDTGGTARMVSRFKPDVPILAGVRDEQIGRLLSLNYGVQAFLIKNPNSNYPFDELEKVLKKAAQKMSLKSGDKIIQVA